MATFPKIDLASEFPNTTHGVDFRWIEDRVREGLSDEQIIEKFKEWDPYWTEESMQFVRWVLYYFTLMQCRDVVPEQENSASQKLEEIEQIAHEEGVDDFEQLLETFITEQKSIKDEDEDDTDDDDDEDEILERKASEMLADLRALRRQAEAERQAKEEENESAEADESAEEEPTIVCKSVSVKADRNATCQDKEYWPWNWYVGFFKQEHYIHIKVDYLVSDECEDDMEVVIQNDRCHTIFQVKIFAAQLHENKGSVVFSLDGEELIPKRITATDKLDIVVRNLTTQQVLYRSAPQLICANTIFDTLHVERMAFFPVQYGADTLQCSTTTGYIEFVKKDLQQINVHCIISSTLGVDFDLYGMRITLYDQTGQSIESHSASLYKDSNSNTYVVYCGISCWKEIAWTEGRYKVEVQALGQTIMVASFRVGGHALEGEADVAQIVSMLRNTALSEGNTKKGALARLDEMVGLKSVKEKIHSLSRLSALAVRRQEMGLPVKGVSLHARFVGNPGTGKTTIAEIMGQIYKDLGLLSSGHVVRVERRNLVGRYYDSELRATEQAIESAQGGVLFIDEAYNLFVQDDPRDPGKHVLEALLTALSDEKRRDWMLILAGYPDEIELMMNANPGIKSRVNETFFFDDYNVEELMQIADLYCKRNKYKMSKEVRKHLEAVVMREYGARDKHFGNARYINNLMEQTIAANMAHRVSRIENPTKLQLQTIEVEDIPSLKEEKTKSRGMDGLNQMVGLTSLKHSISQHLNMVKLANMRIKRGLYTEMPPLHMVFTGNPGTGKTTVADYLGEIYASMGLLSKGDVIRVEKSDLVGAHVGETERKMKSILNRAKGNILFIDEAYQLCAKDGHGDYGENVIEALLTTLSNDKVDMIVILAGYPKDMERLLDMNEGLRSRFPYTFHFEDYSVEELHKIALQRAMAENYILTGKAERKLKALIKREVLRKRSSFGNARFVTRLLSAEILPRMATRLSNEVAEPTKRQLKTIVAEDIPITEAEVKRIEHGGFDDDAIDAALAKLDALVGQPKVKRAIHNFVDVARHLNTEGERFVGKGLLKWNFAGNTGTGKSTVAEILADILKAMNLLDKGNIVEVRGEQIYNVSEYQCDQVLRQAMERSRYGMLFIDGDAPEFRQANEYRMTNEQLRIKLTSLTAELGATGAVVIAECNSPRQTIANSLAINGIYDFDHTFFFDDYSSDELFEILKRRLAKHKVRFSLEAEAKIRKYIDSLCANRNLSFANARTMKHLGRTIYEQVILREIEDKTSPRKVVLLEDVENYIWQQPRKIGY